MAKSRRKGLKITILEDPKKLRGGASRRVGQTVGVSRATGRTRGTSGWSASFIPAKEWVITLDSRDLNAMVGDRLFGAMKKAVIADRDPETGGGHPKTITTTDSKGRRNLFERKVDTRAMANTLRRTVTDSRKRWGGGFKRLSQPKSRMKIYFADRRYAAINKSDSMRKGKDKIVWLGVGGNMAAILGPSIGAFMDIVLEGKQFIPDTKSRARGR